MPTPTATWPMGKIFMIHGAPSCPNAIEYQKMRKLSHATQKNARKIYDAANQRQWMRRTPANSLICRRRETGRMGAATGAGRAAGGGGNEALALKRLLQARQRARPVARLTSSTGIGRPHFGQNRFIEKYSNQRMDVT